MKKVMITSALALLTMVGANAQTIYDGVNIAQKDLNGTARFVGMGGAMSALGGDISTMGTNPAGVGIYRSHDIMTSFGFSAYGSESNYNGSKLSLNNNRWSFDNIGLVFSTKIGNETSLRYVNFGFNYHKSKSFYKNMGMEGLLNLAPGGGVVTQTYQMANQANGATEKMLTGNQAFSDTEVGWLSALGRQGFLINRDPQFPEEDNMYTPFAPEAPYSTFRSEERGGIDQYDFNVAFNFNDRVYFGATIGAYSVDYNKYSFYDEDYGQKDGYSLESWNRISGSGVDFKFGLIFRPIESSPLRLGISLHSPVFYNLTLKTSALLKSDMPIDGEIKHFDIDTYNIVGDMERDYRLRTPWTYNFSLGYTVGSSLALGAEYEYENYSTMKFSYPEGDEMEFENKQTNMLKGVSTFRIGAEYKVIPQFAFRLGYNYSSAAFKDNAVKEVPYNSINTDTDYANAKNLSNYTLGIGYRGDLFYADLAYKYSTYKENFYAFHDSYLDKTKVTNTRSQVLMTIGMRF